VIFTATSPNDVLPLPVMEFVIFPDLLFTVPVNVTLPESPGNAERAKDAVGVKVQFVALVYEKDTSRVLPANGMVPFPVVTPPDVVDVFTERTIPPPRSIVVEVVDKAARGFTALEREAPPVGR
jgi:hypothetical protein